jgi:hypothetical protein
VNGSERKKILGKFFFLFPTFTSRTFTDANKAVSKITLKQKIFSFCQKVMCNLCNQEKRMPTHDERLAPLDLRLQNRNSSSSFMRSSALDFRVADLEQRVHRLEHGGSSGNNLSNQTSSYVRWGRAFRRCNSCLVEFPMDVKHSCLRGDVYAGW